MIPVKVDHPERLLQQPAGSIRHRHAAHPWTTNDRPRVGPTRRVCATREDADGRLHYLCPACGWEGPGETASEAVLAGLAVHRLLLHR